MDLQPWFVTGFLESSASFTFSRSGPRIAVYFAVKLRATDRPLMEALRAHLDGIGTIYEMVGSGYAYYRVCRRSELSKIVAHFDSYPLRGDKQRRYAIWREMVRIKSSRRRPGSEEELQRLALRLHAVSSGAPDPGAPESLRSPDLPEDRDDLLAGEGDLERPFESED